MVDGGAGEAEDQPSLDSPATRPPSPQAATKFCCCASSSSGGGPPLQPGGSSSRCECCGRVRECKWCQGQRQGAG